MVSEVWTWRTPFIDLFGYEKIHMAVYIAADIPDEDFEDVKVFFFFLFVIFLTN